MGENFDVEFDCICDDSIGVPHQSGHLSRKSVCFMCILCNEHLLSLNVVYFEIIVSI